MFATWETHVEGSGYHLALMHPYNSVVETIPNKCQDFIKNVE